MTGSYINMSASCDMPFSITVHYLKDNIFAVYSASCGKGFLVGNCYALPLSY